MNKALNVVRQYLRAFVLIYACLYAGIFPAPLLPITIPGSIIGMLILFVLLALQVLPAKWVNPGCYVLTRYMALLFVPIGVGIMQYSDLLRAQFDPVVVSCIISTLAVFLVVSWSSHIVHGKRKIVGQKEAKAKKWCCVSDGRYLLRWRYFLAHAGWRFALKCLC